MQPSIRTVCNLFFFLLTINEIEVTIEKNNQSSYENIENEYCQESLALGSGKKIY